MEKVALAVLRSSGTSSCSAPPVSWCSPPGGTACDGQQWWKWLWLNFDSTWFLIDSSSSRASFVTLFFCCISGIPVSDQDLKQKWKESFRLVDFHHCDWLLFKSQIISSVCQTLTHVTGATSGFSLYAIKLDLRHCQTPPDGLSRQQRQRSRVCCPNNHQGKLLDSRSCSRVIGTKE